MNIVLSMTLGINALIIFLLIEKIKSNFANTFLLGLLISIFIGTAFTIYIQYFLPAILLAALINSLPVLFGTFTYFYIKQSLFKFNEFKASLLLHLLPFILAVILSIQHHDNLSFVSIFLNIGLKICVSIIYIVVSLKIIQKQQIVTKNHFSNTDSADLKWLEFIVKTGLFSYILYFIILCSWFLQIHFFENIVDYANLIVLIYIIPIAYYGITATNVFVKISSINSQIDSGLEIQETDNSKVSESVSKELISSEKADEIYANLLERMHTQKLYRLENLTLEDLAKELNLHSRYLSYVINTKSGKTFFDFINHFRIQEFNVEVLNPQNKHLTNLAIAYSSGFGSKSSFNRAYKSEMGISPTQFIKDSTSLID